MLTRNSIRQGKDKEDNKQVKAIDNVHNSINVVDVPNFSNVHNVDNVDKLARLNECLDNNSCKSFNVGSSKHSSCGSTYSARTKLRIAQMKEAQLLRQLELEDRIREQESRLKLLKVKDEIEVAQLIVEAEEDELLPNDPHVPVEEKTELMTNYLQDCSVSMRQVNHNKPANEFKTQLSFEHQQSRPTEPKSNNYYADYRLELPKVELSPFAGDVTDYWRFIKQFEAYIEAKTCDPGQRLLYLMNYCKGGAKEEIKNCVMLPPNEAYAQARQRLKDRFGQPHVIARALIADMLSLPRLQNADPTMLSKMVSVMTDCKLVLGQMNYSADVNSIQTLGKLVSKLPTELRQQWSVEADKIYRQAREPDIEDLISFTSEQARIARSAYGMLVRTPDIGWERQVQRPAYADKEKDRFHHKGIVNNVKVEKVWTGSPICPGCKGNHHLETCPGYVALDLDKRWELVKKLKLCFLCLKGKHLVKDCYSKIECKVDGCNRKHHCTLHLKDKTAQIQATVNNTSCKQVSIQLGTVPVILTGPKGDVKTYALVDSGSDSTLVKRDLVEQLGLVGTPTTLCVRTVTGESCIESVKCNLKVTSLDGEHTVSVTDAYSVTKLPNDLRAQSAASFANEWSHLSDIKLGDIGNTDVGLLIGCDTPEAHWVLDQRLGKEKQPFAVKTVFGWMVLGPRARNKGVSRINNIRSEEMDLGDLMRRMYDAEFQDIGNIQKQLSRDERDAMSILDKGTEFAEGRYTVPLPWRSSEILLPNNFTYANKRLQLLKKRFMRDPLLFGKYKDIIDSHIRKGYVEKSAVVKDMNKGEKWYLPHHPVLNPKKPGKVRVVFDCAASYEGVSLNDRLLPGPDMIIDLVGVLIRFRKGSVAITADIEEMFLQVKLPENDRKFMSFLWWDSEDLSMPPSPYRMTVHPFGATSSPFCANYALARTVKDFGQNLCEESRYAATRNIYVDDCITTTDDAVKADTIIKELTTMFNKAGFRLRKWTSNCRDALTHVPQSERSDKIISLTNGQLPTERALGIDWDTETDMLKFTMNLEEKDDTRRGILANVASLFDPLGIISPFTLIARIILQDLCREGRGWDDALSHDHLVRWRKWKEAIPGVRDMTIPRQAVQSNHGKGTQTQLHVFCDASEKGYGAVAYIRCETNGSRWETRLLLAKARVTPIKKVTIPRLELAAALLATRLGRTINDNIDFNFDKTIYWSDSVLVLRYLRNTTSRFVTFVANRIQEILENTAPEQWRYVNTDANPADIASRGSLLQGDARDVWLNGPRFLNEDESQWPTFLEGTEPETPMEVKKTVTACNTQGEVKSFDKLLNYFSEWTKLVRAIAWFSRWKTSRLAIVGKVDSVRVGGLTVDELKSTENDILRYVQKSVYPKEWDTLVENDGKSIRRLLRRSVIGSLNPVNRNGLLCVGGRLTAASIESDRKWPIILPRKHPVTTAIIRDIHRREGHAGVAHMLGMLRERFWIVNAKAVIRRVTRECLKCRKLNAPLSQQQMAPLPDVRVNSLWRPFSVIGVDCFGPFFVRRGRLLEKRYGCLFTCMQCRAIHIELTHSLSMESFMLALSRFVDRRGAPIEIYSDNGGNFIGADLEIRKDLEKWDKERLTKQITKRGVKWNFNPPAASHRGGVWERMIRSVRRVIYTSIGSQSVDEETLLTYLVQAERIINDRPLVPLSEDVSELTPLRPSDMLRPRETNEVNVTEPLGEIAVQRWKTVTDATNRFWNRWKSEYLSTLQLRQKWLTPDRKFKAGDLVIIWTESVPKSCWPLGIVTEVEIGPDGLPRTLSIRTSKGEIKRDIRKVCLLEGTD